MLLIPMNRKGSSKPAMIEAIGMEIHLDLLVDLVPLTVDLIIGVERNHLMVPTSRLITEEVCEPLKVVVLETAHLEADLQEEVLPEEVDHLTMTTTSRQTIPSRKERDAGGIMTVASDG